MGSRTVDSTRPNDAAVLKDLNGRPVSANGVRNGVYKALVKIPLKERVQLYKQLIGELEKAGINVGSRLFLLGIPATIPEELSPNDIGKLIRSVYLNEPKAMLAISETLSQILGRNGGNKLAPPTVSSIRRKRK